MIFFESNAHLKPHFPRIIIPLALLLMFICSGCSSIQTLKETSVDALKKTSETISSPFGSGSGKYTKRIVLAAPENLTVFQGAGLETALRDLLLEEAESEWEGLEILNPGDSGPQYALSRVPMNAAGEIDNFTIAQLARTGGIHAFIRYGIVNIEAMTEEKGILWFKRPKQFGEIQLFIEVYDSETGAKILDESYSELIEIGESEFESIRSRQGLTPDYMAEVFSEMVEVMAESTGDALREEPWKTFVVGVSADSVTLASGSNAGLNVGDRFSVFASREIIKDKAGKRFFMPGQAVAQIQIASVSPDRSVATIETGSGIEIGDTAKPAED